MFILKSKLYFLYKKIKFVLDIYIIMCSVELFTFVPFYKFTYKNIKVMLSMDFINLVW